MARAANYGTTLEKTLIGSILNRFGDKVPYSVWKAASATFAGNAKGTAIKVGYQYLHLLPERAIQLKYQN